MIRTIVKRDGREEDFSPNKVNAWGEWASKTLGTYVDWPTVVLDTVSTCPEKITSEQLQDRLIKTCLDYNTWSYNRMAGRLYAALIYKRLYEGAIPTIKELHQKLIKIGYMVDLGYTDEEYDYAEKLIDHKKDLKASHFELDQVLKKYSLQNRVKKIQYESQQFVFMRMAMTLASMSSPERKLIDLERWYTHLSEKHLNAPTPNFVNLGTKLRSYVSCNLYTTGDSAKSLAIGDHIAYTMTYQSAGIGAHLNTRSLHDPVRSGQIDHQGKLPYYRSLVGAVKANLQAGRGGACTTHFNIFDPEIETLIRLKNPMSTEDKKIRGMDYSVGVNKFFAKKAAKSEDVFLFNTFTAPDLYAALYSGDTDKFEELYEKYENKKSFKKKYVNARELLKATLNEGYETGRIYLHWMDEMNHHTPFKETIYSSNLCVAADTLLTIDVYDQGEKEVAISELADQTVRVWNGIEWSQVVVRKTGEDQPLIEVVVKNLDTGEMRSLKTTPYHKWYLDDLVGNKEVRTFQLEKFDRLIRFDHPSGDDDVRWEVISLNETESGDTYCVNEPKRHMAMFNGILTGQCQEIDLPTSPYEDMKDLYSEDDHGRGEVALCALAGINVDNVHDNETYESATYYALLMIDRCLHLAHYELPHIKRTALSRLSAGVGVIGLAHYLAKNKTKYTSDEGKQMIHDVAERHYYYLVKASLKLGKELGNAPWVNKTKWVDGWLPIDTYNKNVDSVVPHTLKYDWETLRSDIKANGGIRNSVLSAHMPSESSSKASGTTNGLYPVRNLFLKKGDADNLIYWCAPEGEKLKKHYELCWNIPTKDMIDCYAICQKFTDQGISADEFRKILGDEKVGSKEMLTNFFYMTKMGLKSRYYINTKTSDGALLNNDELLYTEPDEVDNKNNEDDEPGCAGGFCSL